MPCLAAVAPASEHENVTRFMKGCERLISSLSTAVSFATSELMSPRGLPHMSVCDQALTVAHEIHDFARLPIQLAERHRGQQQRIFHAHDPRAEV